MRRNTMTLLALSLASLAGLIAAVSGAQGQRAEKSAQPAVPKTWDDKAMSSLEVPLANPRYSPVHVSSDYYYRIPVRSVYKSYPVYHPDKEPPGYLEWLERQEPEIVWDTTKLKTQADWTGAGEIVFEAPVFYAQVGPDSRVRNRAW